MKKAILTALLVTSFISFIEAKSSDYIDKISKLWSLKTNGLIEFNITKQNDSYSLTIDSKRGIYKEFFNKKPIEIEVDEGPLIITPHWTLGRAGLYLETSVSNILNPKIIKDLNGTIGKIPTYKYEGIVTFGDNLESKIEVEPFKIDTKELAINVSKIEDNSKYDLDSFTGEESLKIDYLEIRPKREKGLFKLSNISFENRVIQEPIEDMMLFGKGELKIDDIELNALDRRGKEIYAKVSLIANSKIAKVDKELLDFEIGYDILAKDTKSIALFKGIKESRLEFKLKNLGIKGLVGFLKLNKEMEKMQDEMIEASKSGDNIAIQKAIFKSQEMTNQFVPVWNALFIKDKTKLLLNLDLKSDKNSYIKLDLLYKGKPLSGNAQSAAISLMAQQFKLVDGDFDIAIDSDLISSINPLAILGVDMLKAKGFVSFKDGIYYLKGSLKGGKIIINGKAYTLSELSRALF